MSVTPGEMLDVLDAAIKHSHPMRPNKVPLELVGADRVLGEHGTPVRQPGGTPAFGFTRRQCMRMREHILAAARADAGGPS